MQESFGYGWGGGGGKAPDSRVCGDRLCSEIQESLTEVLDFQYGEYFSLGNTWIELPFSLGNTPPWQKYWETNHPGEYFPRDWDDISTEKVIAENFYKNFDIQIMDVIFSDKNAEYCLGYGCSLGTYHLLISNDDVDKFHNSFGMQESFADSSNVSTVSKMD